MKKNNVIINDLIDYYSSIILKNLRDIAYNIKEDDLYLIEEYAILSNYFAYLELHDYDDSLYLINKLRLVERFYDKIIDFKEKNKIKIK